MKSTTYTVMKLDNEGVNRPLGIIYILSRQLAQNKNIDQWRLFAKLGSAIDSQNVIFRDGAAIITITDTLNVLPVTTSVLLTNVVRWNINAQSEMINLVVINVNPPIIDQQLPLTVWQRVSELGTQAKLVR